MEAVSGLDTRPELKTTSDGDVAVAVRGVHRSFGETKALRGVDFTARAGEIHAVVGENGSGKSTLSKIIAGIIPADEGQVSVLGAPVTSVGTATRAGVNLVLQEVLVAEGRTIAENVLAGHGSLFRSKISRSGRTSRVKALLEELIGDEVDPAALIDTLPLAQRQWVTIARSLLRDPKVLVLDESTAALDLDGAKRLYEVAQLLRDGGACVLIVTHRIAELVAFADRATVLRDGQHVGTLEAADISEESLLALMSGPARADAGVETPSAGRTLGPSRITASGLRLAGGEGFTDLDIAEGEILGLAGLDGQGHTQFLRVLAGVAEAEGGTVEVDGPRGKGRIASLDDAERLGVAFVSGDRRRFGIFPNLSIFENFATHHYRAQARRGLVDRSAARGLFDAQREQLKIRLGDPGDPITSLSGGNQQKVLIGRSLAKEPSVIALDDPARGVDVGTKRDLYSELRRRAGAGATVIYLSSEIDELVGLCDRVAVFRSGSLLTCLAGADITGDAILAAMFGRTSADTNLIEALEGDA